MESAVGVTPHPLVHVRGGPLMLFTALCVSLPPDAQRLLPVLVWLMPSLVVLKAPQLATAAARRIIDSLFQRAVAEVVQSHPTLRQWRPPLTLPASPRLLGRLTVLVLQYLAGRRLANLLVAAPTAAGGGAAANAVAALSEAALCCRVLAAVEAEESVSPAGLRSAAVIATPRLRQTLFATTSVVALQSYFGRVLARSSHEQATVYVPGLLVAPWTTHLATLLRRLQQRHGTRVVGYDVRVDAQRYEVDLTHLRRLMKEGRAQGKATEASRLGATTTGGGGSRITATAASPAPAGTTVLVLASLRGRAVSNRSSAIALARARGWEVVELCLPTLPPLHMEDVTPAGDGDAPPLLLQALRARRVDSLTLPMEADVRITAFDDVGMYGGAVVHLCSHDASLLTHMATECQPALADAEAGDDPHHPNNASPRRRRQPRTAASSLSAGVAASARDVAHRSSEFVTQVWLPWAGRLADALQTSSAAGAMQTAAHLQQRVAASSRAAAGTLAALASSVQSESSPLRLAGKWLTAAEETAGGRDASVAALAGDCGADGGPSAGAAATVEQRTVFIRGPLPPLDVAPPSEQAAADAKPTNASSSPSTSTLNNQTQQQQVVVDGMAPPAESGVFRVRSALTSWLPPAAPARPPSPPAPTQIEARLNTPAEWRIRLRWTALLLATYTDAISGVARRPAVELCPDVCLAAHVSLWSFIVQLPPWITAVSTTHDDAQTEGTAAAASGPGAQPVEAAATAVLVRVASPASAQETARVLREVAAVEARAVVPRRWASRSVASGGEKASESAKVPAGLEEALVMPECPHAAALADDLLFLPLNPTTTPATRDAMLRVLWERVPHAEGVDSGSCSGEWGTSTATPPLRTALDQLYRAYLSATAAANAGGTTGSGVQQGLRPMKACLEAPFRAGVELTEEERRLAFQRICEVAQATAAAAVAPPSFVCGAAAAVTAPVHTSVARKLRSML